MKPLLLPGFLLLAGATLHAQFSITPYAGLEQATNTLRYGKGLTASDVNGNLKTGLRMDYRLRTGHTPFVNVTTSPSPVNFSFTNSGELLRQANAVRSNLQLRLEAGYQYSSKPIQLGKKEPAASNMANNAGSITGEKKKSCGSIASRSRCGSNSKTPNSPAVNNLLSMRLQPALAVAYIPSQVQTVKQTPNGFDYAAGTWRTALVPSLGFEFAKGSQQLFTLTAFYTRPLGQKEEMVTTQLESKTVSTLLQPQSSTWGLTFGVPFSFSSTKATKSKGRTEKKNCTRTYYSRCRLS
jgi:hypothetical protein